MSTQSAASRANLGELSQRVTNIAESATLAVDAKAKALKAAGRPVIGFGAGEPDFPTPAAVVTAAQEACANPATHRYSPTPGLPALREAIADKTERDSDYHVAPSQVVVTNGGKQAVYTAFSVLLNPGDEVILPAPFWTTYPEAIALHGGVTVPVLAGSNENFVPSIEALERARTPKTKAVVICSPSNPTGAVYPVEHLTRIAAWAHDHGLWVITDEIYEHLTYDGVQNASVPVLLPELADRCIVLNGVAKTYAMTGWRVGWLIGPAAVAKAATTLQSHLTSNVCNVAQHAAIAALRMDLSDISYMREAFDRRRQTITRMLNDIDGITCPTPHGAFYAFPNMTGLLGRTIAGRTVTTTAELAEVVLDAAEVAIVPGEAFGSPGYCRFSYALADVDLEEGITRLGKLLS